MSGIYGHIARRGLDAFNAPSDSQMIDSLKSQAQTYDNDPSNAPSFIQLMALLITFVSFVALYASAKYTLGEVVSSLAMIEQPETVILTERKAVDSSKVDEATSEKALLMDEEVMVMQQEPVTSSIRKTLGLLTSVGGRRSRWRGAGAACAYHIAHSVAVELLCNVLLMVLPGFTPAAKPVFIWVTSTIATVLLCRIHMTWTHVMISKPSELPWFKRVPGGKKYFKALALPSLVFSLAQHLVVLIPAGVFLAWGPLPNEKVDVNPQNEILRLSTSLASAAFVALALLLPASVTLTRVEASLLPEDQETIVKFDRTLNGAATFAVSDNKVDVRALFDGAWRSFDRASRLRLVKFYVKMGMTLAAITVLGAMAVMTIASSIGFEKLLLFVDVIGAQIKLAKMGVDY